MKTLIFTLGSRGDIQPFVALARALNKAGHEAVIGGPAASIPFANMYDVRMFPIDQTIREWCVARDPDGASTVTTPLPTWRKTANRRRHLVRLLSEELLHAEDEHPDALVYNLTVPGSEIAEWLNIPAVPVSPNACWVPTNSYTDPRSPLQTPRALNRRTCLLINYRLAAHRTKALNDWREKFLGLPRRVRAHSILYSPDGTDAMVLHAVSKHALPDNTSYPESVYTTGFWLLPSPPNWLPSDDLLEFLDSREPPVCVSFGIGGFGSYTDRARIVAKAIKTSGVRAILVGALCGLEPEEFGQQVVHLDEAPFDWLLPQTAAILHQGGTGVTGASLAAGQPQIICPLPAKDQWSRQLCFHAREMHAKGVSPGLSDKDNFTAEKLARIIHQAVTDKHFISTAQAVGRKIRAENGVTTAIRLIEHEVQRWG